MCWISVCPLSNVWCWCYIQRLYMRFSFLIFKLCGLSNDKYKEYLWGFPFKFAAGVEPRYASSWFLQLFERVESRFSQQDWVFLHSSLSYQYAAWCHCSSSSLGDQGPIWRVSQSASKRLLVYRNMIRTIWKLFVSHLSIINIIKVKYSWGMSIIASCTSSLCWWSL